MAKKAKIRVKTSKGGTARGYRAGRDCSVKLSSPVTLQDGLGEIRGRVAKNIEWLSAYDAAQRKVRSFLPDEGRGGR